MEEHSHKFTCPNCGRRMGESYHYQDECDEADDDCESWEVYADLYYEKDYPGLVKYCEAEVARRPDDLSAKDDLGNAYVLNGQPQKAIDLMAECHRQGPDRVNVQHIILDALFALGKTEDDFPWVKVPTIIRLDAPLMDDYYEFLRPKRKPRSVADLYSEKCYQGYLAFSREELMLALAHDGRFEVDPEQGCFHEQVTVKRKRHRNRNR